MQNRLLIDSLQGKDVERTPVWIMRQAGRYSPRYQAIRKQHDFLTMIKTPKIASEVTLQPVEEIGVDAAILFCDILVIPEAMGMDLRFEDHVGPTFASPIRNDETVRALKPVVAEESLAYVLDAITQTKKQLDGRVPLIGFAGAPLTVAAFMISGKSPRDMKELKQLMYREPATLHRLLDLLSTATIAYAKAQIAAGIEVFQLFDTLAGFLSPEDYRTFGNVYNTHILNELADTGIPTILFAKGQGQMIDELADSGAQALSIDWMTDITHARETVGDRVVLQGNLDPYTLYASPEMIDQHVATLLKRFGHGHGHIVNLGHGLLPDMNVEHVKAFVSAVKSLSPQYHKETPDA